jgi:hypothetical protein
MAYTAQLQKTRWQMIWRSDDLAVCPVRMAYTAQLQKTRWQMIWRISATTAAI